ncbi:MAG: NYN domain-containing protein [archaeon]|nr:NYN domain-containing protein [Nanoarchaeota archaeon]
MTNNKEIQINQSVAILCDGNNIERSIHELSNNTNTMINFDTLIPRLLNGRGLNRFIYFREGKNISSKFAERLHEKYYGMVVPCHKSADIPLSIKATQLASKVDTIIIMSGDSDYVELVRHLKAEGVRVEIAAVKETTAKILKDEAEHFHPITRSDWFSYGSSRQMQRNSSTKKGSAGKMPTVIAKIPEPVKEHINESNKEPVKEKVEAPVTGSSAKKHVPKKKTSAKKAVAKKVEEPKEDTLKKQVLPRINDKKAKH